MQKTDGKTGRDEDRANELQWRCDLAKGILKPLNTDTLALGGVGPRFVELGLPSLSNIPLSPQLVHGHPLRSFITQSSPISAADLSAILSHPSLDLSLVGFHSGTVTAAVHEQLMHGGKVAEEEDYSRNMWARDGIITAAALNRAGYPDHAHKIVKNLWQFAGGPHHRGKILQFHWGGVEFSRRLFLEGNNGPHIKYSVNPHGHLEWCNHDWGHQQLDALGAMIWAPYRFANQRGGIGPHTRLDLRLLDPMPEQKDSILPAAIKMLHGVQSHDTMDYGPWEDIREWRRASSVGIVLSALNEARIFHEREGWDYLPVEYAGKQDGAAFHDQLESTLYNCLRTVQSRVPTEGDAVECDRRPHDSALVFLLYPFECNLKLERQNSILRSVYRNMGEVGFRRWDNDRLEGPDRYVGQDYFSNTNHRDKGEFATLCDGFRAAEWSLFDPLLSAYFYRRFVHSGGNDYESLLYGDRHLKRSLSFITKEPHALFVAGKDREYTIPQGILPEAFAWDSARQEWRPNHNSPLLMAQAALGLAFERAREACRLAENRRWLSSKPL